MDCAWVGFHAEGLPPLEGLLHAGAPIRAVLTLEAGLAARRRGGGDFQPLCDRYGVPLHRIPNINEPRSLALLRALAPDVVFVIGWPQLVRPEALRTARLGMVGAHASLLPHNRGSAPLAWTLLHGEPMAGTSIFWLAEDRDAVTLIAQRALPIAPYDTIATLLARVAAANRELLIESLPRILAGERRAPPLPPSHGPPLRRRRPADGEVDWHQSAQAVYDRIRALTHPLPGAFSWLDGRCWRIWGAALPPAAPGAAPPGTVIGPVVSPVPAACGLLVACGDGAILILDIESPAGERLRGRELSDAPWSGRRWESASAQGAAVPAAGAREVPHDDPSVR
jgi:methionyl-tRNA formyltransferase